MSTRTSGPAAVPEHVLRRTIQDDVVDPTHATRRESPTFRAAKRRLKADGHWRCWICGRTDALQVHHFLAEYMFKDLVDLAVMKEVAEALDPYGYGRLLRHQPLTDPEDIRGLLVLCAAHHTGVDTATGGSGTGIHELTFPTWIMQKLAKAEVNPVPQPGETFADVLKRLASATPGGDA
jgi:hypothetical protein